MAAPGVVAILLSFYGTLLRALIIALLFAPMQHWLQRRLGGRPTLAALVTLDAVVLIVVLPVGLMNELARLHSEVQSGEVKPQTWLHQMFDSLPPAWPACTSVSAWSTCMFSSASWSIC